MSEAFPVIFIKELRYGLTSPLLSDMFRGVTSLAINKAGTSDVITFKSRDIENLF